MVIALSLAGWNAHSAALYNNLGPGNTFIVNREYDSPTTYLATPFTITAGGALDDILTPVFSLDSPVSFGLYSDSSGLPGSLLEGWSSAVPGFPAQFVTLDSVLHPLLAADTQYWFVISQTSRSQVAWYENSQGAVGGIWESPDSQHWLQFVPNSPMPALQVNSASPVPELANTAWSLGGALLLLALFKTSAQEAAPSAEWLD